MNIISRVLQGVLNTAGAATAAAATARELLFRKFTYTSMRHFNAAAVAGTTAIAEVPIGSIKMPMRLVEAKLCPGTATTANATNYLTVLVDARLAATPFTARNLITFAMDTPTTDDLTAFDEKDLMAYATATLADLSVSEGEIITVEVTKTGGSGLAYPIGTLELRFAPRDA
jgi:hypothetical protein